VEHIEGEGGFVQGFDESYDLVVIGCGAAGLAAASSAAESMSEATNGDYSIAVLERAPKEERGGNTRWTGAYLRLKDTSTVADRFVEDMLEFSDGLSDERYIRTLAEKAPETISWIQDKGVQFDYLPTIFLTLKEPRLLPVGGGAAIVETLAQHVEELGVSIFYETTAQRLVMGEDGLLAGLQVRGSDGRLRWLGAKAIIIAAGGFEGNPEMMTQYIGRNAVYVPPIAKGGQYNKGEGIRMALEVGAEPAGQWDAFHAEPVDPRSSESEAVVMTFPYGILINKDGERFLDEGAGTVDEIYESVARTILYDQDQVAYLIIDKKMFEIPEYQRAIQTDQEPYRADTIVDLAENIGVDSQTLERTVSDYNEAARGDPSSFDPFRPDGLATSGDLVPPKSNWARPIDEPPYLAYPIACSIVFTFGGIATNERAEVLSSDGKPIPGLYAAGEAAGLYYGKYPGSTSVLRCLTFGKIAGSCAVEYMLERSTLRKGS
jgi:tricarballylate dehydrogenase